MKPFMPLCASLFILSACVVINHKQHSASQTTKNTLPVCPSANPTSPYYNAVLNYEGSLLPLSSGIDEVPIAIKPDSKRWTPGSGIFKHEQANSYMAAMLMKGRQGWGIDRIPDIGQCVNYNLESTFISPFDHQYRPHNLPNSIRYTPITGSFLDKRDGHVYKTITIGTQEWMAENLAYKLHNGCKYYNDDSQNGAIYGLLYNYYALKRACPKGWHIPTDAEWQQLEYNAGMSARDTSQLFFRGNIAPSFFTGGSTGLNVKFGGEYIPGIFFSKGQIACFFTSSHAGVSTIVRSFSYGDNRICNTRLGKGYWLSIRCVKD